MDHVAREVQDCKVEQRWCMHACICMGGSSIEVPISSLLRACARQRSGGVTSEERIFLKARFCLAPFSCACDRIYLLPKFGQPTTPYMYRPWVEPSSKFSSYIYIYVKYVRSPCTGIFANWFRCSGTSAAGTNVSGAGTTGSSGSSGSSSSSFGSSCGSSGPSGYSVTYYPYRASSSNAILSSAIFWVL